MRERGFVLYQGPSEIDGSPIVAVATMESQNSKTGNMVQVPVEKSYPCYRCDGEGRIRAFGHVLGGVCFKCGGSGRQKSKPSVGHDFVVVGHDPSTGEEVECYNERAKTAGEALKKAQGRIVNASADFRAEHDLSRGFAVPRDEWWTDERRAKAEVRVERARAKQDATIESRLAARKAERLAEHEARLRAKYGDKLYPATCSKCDARIVVPFKPRGDKPIYCVDCY